jgi:hypothetical protein
MLRRIWIVLGAVVITALLGLSSGVANARVEIATGADAGRAATTDPTKSSR